jgi:hypothetical protein
MGEHFTVTRRYELDFGPAQGGDRCCVHLDIEPTRVNEHFILCTARHITTASPSLSSPRAVNTSICDYRYLALWTSICFVLGLKYLITFSRPHVNLWLSGRQVCGLIKLHNELVRLTKLICHRQEYERVSQCCILGSAIVHVKIISQRDLPSV